MNKKKNTIPSAKERSALPLAISPLLLFLLLIMMTRPSPSLLLQGAPFVPIDMDRWNARPLPLSLSLSLRGPSDTGCRGKLNQKVNICALENYNFRFQEKNLNLDWDLNFGPPDL